MQEPSLCLSVCKRAKAIRLWAGILLGKFPKRTECSKSVYLCSACMQSLFLETVCPTSSTLGRTQARTWLKTCLADFEGVESTFHPVHKIARFSFSGILLRSCSCRWCRRSFRLVRKLSVIATPCSLVFLPFNLLKFLINDDWKSRKICYDLTKIVRNLLTQKDWRYAVGFRC